jgi:hypothetical protein
MNGFNNSYDKEDTSANFEVNKEKIKKFFKLFFYFK